MIEINEAEPVRLLLAIEVRSGDSEDLRDALDVFFKIKAPNVSYNVNLVRIVEDGQKD
tara:strand:- start:171 stop:344 length:174 start_codon:yes stop_codon:yes gene_type:complete